MGQNQLLTARVATPVGGLHVFVPGKGLGALVALCFDDGLESTRRDLERRFGALPERAAADPAGVVSRLRSYLAGDLSVLASITVDPGGTPFQQAVWAALRNIEPGQTCSYSDLARTIGRPTAVRAVGAANGRNPIPVVVPCHRVVAADGSLWGYGGGLERKRWLLEHEGVRLQSHQLSLLDTP